jgi:hypothetical protein
MDFLATFAALVGQSLPEGAGPDSRNVLAALLGESAQGREEIVTEGMQGQTVYRRGEWALILPHDGPAVYIHTNTESGNAPEPQLYHLAADIGQRGNLASARLDLVRAMTARLAEIVASERTRPVAT